MAGAAGTVQRDALGHPGHYLSGMSKILSILGATVGSAIGWWLGAHVGIMTAFFVSIFGTAIGVYAGRRIAASLLG